MAGSLAMVASRAIDRAELAASMIRSLHAMSRKLLIEKHEILCRYRKDCITLNRDVVLVRGEEKRYGHALDIDDNGALVVRFANDSQEVVNSGEVSIRGMYGYL